MRLIDADNLASRKFPAEAVSYARVEGWYGNGWNDAIDTIMEDEPSVPLPDFKEGYKQAIRDGKTNFSRPHGEWVESDVPESILSKCSLCGFHCGAKTFNFCPMCGADMRKEAYDESGRIQK